MAAEFLWSLRAAENGLLDLVSGSDTKIRKRERESEVMRDDRRRMVEQGNVREDIKTRICPTCGCS